MVSISEEKLPIPQPTLDSALLHSLNAALALDERLIPEAVQHALVEIRAG